MMARKPHSTAERPPPHTDEASPDDRRQPSARERPRPVEPFEECGPTGGYGGAGTEDQAKDGD